MSDQLKRITIGVEDAQHQKVTALTEKLGLSNQWHLFGLLIDVAEDTVETPRFRDALAGLKTRLGLSKAREKQFQATVNALPANAKDRLASMSPDELLALLNRVQ